MRAYLTALRLRAMLELQYRFAAFTGTLTQIFFGFFMIFLYEALFDGQDPRGLAQTVAYVWLQQAFFRLILSSDPDLRNEIINGNIGYALCRPVSIYGYWTVRIAAGSVVGSLMRAAPMLALAALIPAPYGLSAPASPGALLAFGVTLCLGVVNMAAINMILNGTVLLTMDFRGAVSILTFVHSFLAGNLLPLTLLPDAWQRFVLLTPSAQALDVPIRFYTGQLALQALPTQLLVQAAWALALTMMGVAMWRYGLRRLVLQGG